MARKANLRLVIVAVVGLLTASGSALADELHVPVPYGTIQAAIDDSNDGDVVIVADGTHAGAANRNIDFGGRAITVRSLNGPEFTVIDCEGKGRGLYFHSGEDGNSVLSGLTITNGRATSSSPGSDGGGAIFCEDNSNPTITNCVFITNSAPQRSGGAINAISSSPVIRNCTFMQNQAKEHAGAVRLGNSSALVDSCVFIGNHCDDYSADGGAMYIGGMSSPTVFNCIFIGNKCDWRNGAGGAIRTYADASPVITNCTFVGNKGYSGGAIANVRRCNPVIANCVFWGNDARISGDELRNDDDSRPTISFCNVQGGWNGSRIKNTDGSYVINGGGNINANPLFVNGPLGDYYLSQIIAGQSSDSPCVDAGSDYAANLGLDMHTTRTDGIADGGIVDIGYHYPAPMEVGIVIKPGSCPNPLNVKSRGVLPVAILGSEDFDVNAIDAVSVRLVDVAPVRHSFEDVATVVPDGNECQCTTEGPDGYLDLTIKFKTQQVVEELLNSDVDLVDGQTITLTLTAALSDGTAIEGTDCIVLVGNVSKALAARRWDANRDGIINMRDLAEMATYWLESAELRY